MLIIYDWNHMQFTAHRNTKLETISCNMVLLLSRLCVGGHVRLLAGCWFPKQRRRFRLAAP